MFIGQRTSIGIITAINYTELFVQFRNSEGYYFSKTFQELYLGDALKCQRTP